MERRNTNRGIALPTAMAAALIVSVVAALVLGVAFRRFERSAFRTDQKIATTLSEASLNYVFSRLAADDVSDGAAGAPNGLDDNIRFDDDLPYVLSTQPVGVSVTVRFNSVEQNVLVDEQLVDGDGVVLEFDRDVHVVVDLETPGDPVNSRFEVHTSVDYGE